MTRTRYALIGLCTLLLTSCAHAHLPPAPEALTSGAPAGDDTYFLLQGTSSGIAAIDRELESSLRLALADKGWLEVAPRDARTAIVTNVASASKRTPASFYAGWGGWQWQSAHTATKRNQAYAPDTLVVDAFDAATHKLFSRGAAHDLVQSVEGRTTLSEHRLEQLARALPAPADAAVVAGDTAPHAEIAFVQGPVAVVRIAGTARYETVSGTDLQRVVNTPSFVVRDIAGMHFLKLPAGWMEADTLRGPWAVAGTVPAEARMALQLTSETNNIEDPEIIPASRGNSSITAAPQEIAVVVTSDRTTVIVTDGELALAPLEGTALLRASNTNAPLFREPTDAELYVRLPQGWYRAWSLDGPWLSIAQSDLPADFSRVASEMRP